MRRFSTECGAERPWTLCGTGLRKHIATISVALDLSENDVSDLAQYGSCYSYTQGNIQTTCYK